MKKLRVATMVSGQFTTPPPEGVIYAPMDIAVGVSQGLVGKGHEVTFFAPEGSHIDGVKVESLGLKQLSESNVLKELTGQGADVSKIHALWSQFLIANMFKRFEKGEFDIMHIHPVDRTLPIALSHPHAPTFYTLHDPVDPWRGRIYKMFESSNQKFISISDAQRKPAEELNWAGTVYNGIDMERFAFKENKEDYFLLVGRLVDKKGVAEAVEVSRKAGVKLVILGPIGDQDLWDKSVAPYLDNKNIIYPGLVSGKELVKYYQGARALLFPIKWEEPFGLVMTEAMSCGTPVIAFNRGSVPEVIEDGKNGFIVEDVSGMAEAIKKIDSIKSKDCRKSVEEKFSIEKMVDGYEKIFLNS